MQKKVDEAFDKQLKAARRKAYAAQTMSEALINSIGEGLIIVNEYGTITHINQAALDMLGYKKGELEGLWLPKAIPIINDKGKSIAPSERMLVKALVTGATVSENAGYTRKDGSILQVAGTASPFMVKGSPKGAVIVFRDISKELQIERAKDEFISLVSHQLRTPLTSISLFSEMLAGGQAGQLKPKQKEYAEKINLSATRMIRLVGNILNLSRVDLGRLKPLPVEVDLSKLISSRVEEVRPVAEAKKIRISFLAPNQPMVTKLDPILFGQVIHNLLINAVRYTPSGRGLIKINLGRTDSDYRIAVSDNGIGIPAKAHSRVFDRFYRADNAMNIVGEGTGLGLYLAKMIVEDIGGRIWFKSTEGIGTVFFLTIPAPKQIKRRNMDIKSH